MIKVEDIKKGTLVKRKADAKKTYVRNGFNKSTKKYELSNYDDISDIIEVKKGTLLLTDWNENE